MNPTPHTRHTAVVWVPAASPLLSCEGAGTQTNTAGGAISSNNNLIFEGDLIYSVTTRHNITQPGQPTGGPVSQVGVSVVLSALTPE